MPTPISPQLELTRTAGRLWSAAVNLANEIQWHAQTPTDPLNAACKVLDHSNALHTLRSEIELFRAVFQVEGHPDQQPALFPEMKREGNYTMDG